MKDTAFNYLIAAVAIAIAFHVDLRWARRLSRRNKSSLGCTQCGYNVSTQLTLGRSECSECGCVLKPKSKLSKRRAAVLFYISPVAVNLLCITVAAVSLFVSASALMRRLPLVLVLDSANFAKESISRVAVCELSRRCQTSCSTSDVNKIIESALRNQRNRSIYWDSTWGDIVEYERQLGNVSDEQWSSYAAEGSKDMVYLDVPPTMHKNSSARWFVRTRPGRFGSSSDLEQLFYKSKFTQRKPLAFEDASQDSIGICLGVSGGEYIEGEFAVSADVAPGPKLAYWTAVQIVGQPNSDGRLGINTITSTKIELTSEFRVE